MEREWERRKKSKELGNQNNSQIIYKVKIKNILFNINKKVKSNPC